MPRENIANFDFHLHTYWSYDALAAPVNYFKHARELGITHIALTEHHNMDSLPEAMEISKDFPEISFIPAAELSVRVEGVANCLDLVCLNLPVDPSGEIKELLDMYHKWQNHFGDKLCKVLTEAGMPHTREERAELIKRFRPAFTLDVQGVPHVRNDISDRYLVDEKHYDPDMITNTYHAKGIPPHYPAYKDVVPVLKRNGCLVFIAHPTSYFKRNDLERMDFLREELQLDGIECAHPSIPHELTPFYREYCLKHGLLSTAGTDCHSTEESDPKYRTDFGDMGCHIGEKRWLEEILERVDCLHG